MLQKFHITICAIIVGLFSVLFSPYTAVANDAKCNNIKLLNKASQDWCRSKGWGMDTKGRWVQMKGGESIKNPGSRRWYERKSS